MVGIASWLFQAGTPVERIEGFVRLGFDAVSFVPRDALSLCRGESADVDDAIRRHSLAVTIHGGMAGPDGIDESRLLAEFESYLVWHERTGALKTVNYDGVSGKTDSGTVEYCAKEMRSVLKRMLEMSVGTGVTVGVEDWPRDAQMLETVGDLVGFPHYGILIDLGHMNMRIGNDKPGMPYPVEAARSYLDNITPPVNEVHIHNNDGARDLHAPFDAGTADLRAVAGLIKPRCARAVFTVEIVSAFCGITEEEALSASAEALRIWRSLLHDL